MHSGRPNPEPVLITTDEFAFLTPHHVQGLLVEALDEGQFLLIGFFFKMSNTKWKLKNLLKLWYSSWCKL